MRGRGRPRGSRDRRGRAFRVDVNALAFTMRSFGEQMRHVREDADVSADELAQAVGVSVDVVLHWEAGRRTPRLRNLVSVAMALRVPVDHLVPEC